MLGAVVIAAAALFAVLERDNLNGAIVGLSVSYALQVCTIYIDGATGMYHIH